MCDEDVYSVICMVPCDIKIDYSRNGQAGARTGAASVMMTAWALAATNQKRVIAWRASVELIVRCVTRTCTRVFVM